MKLIIINSKMRNLKINILNYNWDENERYENGMWLFFVRAIWVDECDAGNTSWKKNEYWSSDEYSKKNNWGK